MTMRDRKKVSAGWFESTPKEPFFGNGKQSQDPLTADQSFMPMSVKRNPAGGLVKVKIFWPRWRA
jgi:hypothetical protein